MVGCGFVVWMFVRVSWRSTTTWVVDEGLDAIAKLRRSRELALRCVDEALETVRRGFVRAKMTL